MRKTFGNILTFEKDTGSGNNTDLEDVDEEGLLKNR